MGIQGGEMTETGVMCGAPQNIRAIWRLMTYPGYVERVQWLPFRTLSGECRLKRILVAPTPW